MWIFSVDDTARCYYWNVQRRVMTSPLCGPCASAAAISHLLGMHPQEVEGDSYPDGGHGLRAATREDAAARLLALSSHELYRYVSWLMGPMPQGPAPIPCECEPSVPLGGGHN